MNELVLFWSWLCSKIEWHVVVSLWSPQVVPVVKWCKTPCVDADVPACICLLSLSVPINPGGFLPESPPSDSIKPYSIPKAPSLTTRIGLSCLPLTVGVNLATGSPGLGGWSLYWPVVFTFLPPIPFHCT